MIYFILSKGIAFVAPILFLKFVSLEEYGIVEFSYSFGSVLAVIAGLGLSGAYPYFILREKRYEKEQVFMAYGFPVLFVALFFCILRWEGILGARFFLIVLFTLIFSLQRLYSSVLKSNEKGYLGVLFDGGYYFILAIVIFLVWIFDLKRPILLLEISMQVYLFALVTFFLYRFYTVRTKSWIALRSDCALVLRYSVHLIFSGIIIYWLTSSARIYIGYFMGYEQVGVYSFYFRLTGMAVIIHQFLYIAFFRRLYMGNVRQLDIYYSLIMGLVIIGCLLCYLCLPLLCRYFFSGVDVINAKLFLLLTLQMPIWVGISLCEGLLGRENLIKKMNLRVGACVFVFPAVLFLLRGRLTLELFTLLNTVNFSIAFALQNGVLREKGFVLAKCTAVNLILLISSCLTYFL